MNNKPSGISLGSGWMVVAALCFALMSACVKLGAGSFGSVELLFWRTSIGALALGGAMAWRRQTPWTPNWAAHARRSLVGYLALLATFYALIHLPLSTAVTLSYTSSLAFALLCIVKLRERPTAPMLLALALGFIGIVLLLRPSLTSAQWIAAMVGLASGVLGGVTLLQVCELGVLGEPSWRTVFWFFAISSAFGLAWLVAGPGFSPVTAGNVWPLLGVGVFGMLGQLTMTHAYQQGRKYLVASFAYLTVVFSALLGVCLWGDALNWEAALAMLLIVGSGLLAARR
ncbi:DMT family transporter [Janthinobacterium fluminis]|uniref:DMT family transporter n=1 Tax=Janthinobacterium fluminis TaxID=2987524 RepID=A0ABT5K7X2_9BURK|nr:DMT family transporter [Janthinobacterium fluminis]MDC8760911.1 DMT family transporter [Janthinobacterium fluminis]